MPRVWRGGVPRLDRYPDRDKVASHSSIAAGRIISRPVRNALPQPRLVHPLPDEQVVKQLEVDESTSTRGPRGHVATHTAIRLDLIGCTVPSAAVPHASAVQAPQSTRERRGVRWDRGRNRAGAMGCGDQPAAGERRSPELVHDPGLIAHHAPAMACMVMTNVTRSSDAATRRRRVDRRAVAGVNAARPTRAGSGGMAPEPGPLLPVGSGGRSRSAGGTDAPVPCRPDRGRPTGAGFPGRGAARMARSRYSRPIALAGRHGWYPALRGGELERRPAARRRAADHGLPGPAPRATAAGRRGRMVPAAQRGSERSPWTIA